MTLEDLQLKLEERITLKSCDKQFRHALYKAGEHICLTAYPECCRKTAWNYRKYMMDLTLRPENKVDAIDDSSFERAQKRSLNYFSRPNVSDTK